MEDTVDNPVVTSVGNSWIVCRSKSHPDRIYYFNTYSGEAAWNLSEVEIEKAKKATKIFESSGVNMDGCPEPKDPPQDNPNYNTRFDKYLDNIPFNGTAKICNHKIKCVKPNQTHFAPPPFKNQCCNHTNTISNIDLGYHMACGLNPKVWNIPTQQISNKIPSIMNKSQYQMDLYHNKFGNRDLTYVQSTCVPLNKRFEILNKIVHNNGTESSVGTKVRDDRILMENDNTSDCNLDLRDYISRKRQIKFSNETDEPIQLLNTSRLINDKTLGITKSTDKTACNQRGVADNNSIIKDPEHDSTLVKKNVLLRLKNIAKRILHKDLWYIVPDVNTFLYHQEFLKFLVESDEECRLMVLENVMTEIRDQSRSDNIDVMNNGRRAMYYISQSIRAGEATMGKDPAAANNKCKSYILDCCLKLSKENYHIILLCNDKDLHEHEKAACIPMFTVSEMKSFFGADFKEETNMFHMNPLTKITAPSNQIRSVNVGSSVGLLKEKSDNENINVTRKISTVHTGTQTKADLHCNKITIDVGIQTNLDKRLTSHIKSIQTIQSSLQMNSLDKATDSLDGAGVKRKEIKLNRSLSSPSSKKEDTEKKNFKWRRKRIVFNIENADTGKLEEKSDTENGSEVIDSENICKISNDINPSASNKNNNCEDISLNENSTREIPIDVILNAKTNVSSEIVFSGNDNKTLSNVNNEENKNSNCFMFEITSQSMEEYLKTRSDEWVSRFLQIMEEVLTQLLQKDSSTNTLSPPWSVHEATQCIKMKHFENRDIVDAANKLSEILFICSDPKGKIDINMSPDQFMKLYSYAVYLIDSLQVVVQNSEDLQIASESMAKLLNDIQNPNLDNSQNDSFTDTTQDTAVEVSSVATSNTDKERNVPFSSPEGSTYSCRRDLRNLRNFEPSPKYYLRSQWKRIFQNNAGDSSPSLDEYIRPDDPESQFFTSLNLRKNHSNHENENTNVPGNASTISTFPTPLETKEKDTVNKEPSVDVSTSKTTENNSPKEQRIVRNFTLNPDIEAKIKNKESELIFNDIDKEKSSYVEDDFKVDDNFESDEELQDEGAISTSPIENDKLKYVVSMLVREIRESFLVVYAFCEESQKLLKGPDVENDAKRILKTAEETHFFITQLFGSLSRIHDRDVTEMERLFAKFLDSDELKDLKFNENDFLQYRDLIGKCIEQASLLRDSVECIMSYVV